MQLLPDHQTIMDGFLTACQTDDRIAAALHVGSYVKGQADDHSDLDLYVITTDDAYEDVIASRSAFVEKLGEPLFLEDFGHPETVFLIFSNGAEVEISFAGESQQGQLLTGPYKVLVDKTNVTAGLALHERAVEREAQTERLRLLVYGFWHELAHFTTALARGQLWWAQGQLHALRLHCMNLTRLQNDFSDPDIGEEGYFKIDTAIPMEQLSALEETYCPMDREALGRSALRIVRFFHDLAPGLAAEHGLAYPARLEHVMIDKLEEVQSAVDQ